MKRKNKVMVEIRSGCKGKLGDNHLILRGGDWHFLEINILTLQMLKINDLFSFGKKINNISLDLLKLGEMQIFQKKKC